MQPTQSTHAMQAAQRAQRTHAIVAAQLAIATPSSVPALSRTPALAAVAALPATAALFDVLTLPTTATLLRGSPAMRRSLPRARSAARVDQRLRNAGCRRVDGAQVATGPRCNVARAPPDWRA